MSSELIGFSFFAFRFAEETTPKHLPPSEFYWLLPLAPRSSLPYSYELGLEASSASDPISGKNTAQGVLWISLKKHICLVSLSLDIKSHGDHYYIQDYKMVI